MLFDNPLVDILICIGIILIIIGIIFLKFPPKRINYLYGYRTKSSMKSQERWDFAQKYSAIELIKSGFALGLIGVLCLILELQLKHSIIIGLGIMILNVLLLLFRVEKKLKDKFS